MFELETCRRCWQTFSAGMMHTCQETDTKVTTTASTDLNQAEGSQNVTNNPS